MQQQSIAVVASLLLVLSASAPAAAVSVGGYQLGGEDPRDLPQTTYGVDGHASFVVELADTSTSAEALQQWATASDSRTLVTLDNASKTATVAGPAWSVSAGGIWTRLGSLSSLSLAAFTADPLAEEGFVEAVHPNYQHSLTRPDRLVASDFTPETGITALDDPAFPTNGLAFSDEVNETTPAEWRHAVEADGQTADGEDITVAVIDSGANVLSGQVYGNGSVTSPLRVSEASKSFITGETLGENGTDAIADLNGHGSWTAAAIAANTSGTTYDAPAKDTSLLVLKALNSEGSGSTSDIAQAIRYAADHDADVISLSLGSPLYDAAIADAIRYAHDQGVKATVVAAGNTREFSPGLGSPADLPGVIAVGATNGTTTNATAASAHFSQYSGAQIADGNATNPENVDVVAPGQKTTVRTPTPDGYLRNATLSGTSMATPIVASGIAEALSANATLRSMDHAEIHAAVTKSARPTPNMAAAEAGHGLFSVENLVTGDYPATSQTEAMDDDAQQRQTFYEGLGTGQGIFARVAGAA